MPERPPGLLLWWCQELGTAFNECPVSCFDIGHLKRNTDDIVLLLESSLRPKQLAVDNRS